jgi:predicted nucleic-acid-binding Zn-ribbon protein
LGESNEMSATKSTCPECGGATLYTTTVNAAGGYGPNFLPGLGGFFRMAKFDVVVCATCGLTRFYAEAKAREKLPQSARWQKV